MAAFSAHSLLMDGFTTMRDLGTLQSGNRRSLGFRTLETRSTYKAGQLRMTFIADGYAQVPSAARQNLANRASFIKTMMGDGIFSSKDPAAHCTCGYRG